MIRPEFGDGKVKSKLYFFIASFSSRIILLPKPSKVRSNYSEVLHNNNVRPFQLIKRTFFPDYCEETHIMNSPSPSPLAVPKSL